jgi:hypothetical protein
VGRTIESTITAATSTAAAAHVIFFDSNRRIFAQPACSGTGAEDVAPGMGRGERVSRGLVVS